MQLLNTMHEINKLGITLGETALSYDKEHELDFIAHEKILISQLQRLMWLNLSEEGRKIIAESPVLKAINEDIKNLKRNNSFQPRGLLNTMTMLKEHAEEMQRCKKPWEGMSPEEMLDIYGL